MRLEYQILVAVALDLLLGDPRWFPHPVKFIGRFALALEAPFRKVIPNPAWPEWRRSSRSWAARRS